MGIAGGSSRSPKNQEEALEIARYYENSKTPIMVIPVSEVPEEESLTSDEQLRGKRGVDRLTEEEVREYFKDHLSIPNPSAVIRD